MGEAVIKELAGVTDGVNTTFTTPTRYVLTTLRVVWNGQVYEPTHTKFGWTEVDDTTIQLITAPRAGDCIQAFYQDADAAPPVSLDEVKGSPFHPTGALP